MEGIAEQERKVAELAGIKSILANGRPSDLFASALQKVAADYEYANSELRLMKGVRHADTFKP